ncbi:MAG: CotH kinase family protein [Anaerolineae bacterium]|nr:CotH kinase family protein [Anaerolineae bacterium]
MSLQWRSSKKGNISSPVVWMLVFLAFVMGVVVARLSMWGAAVADFRLGHYADGTLFPSDTPQAVRSVPRSPTPVAPTATPVATPTPTSPEVNGDLETFYIDIAPDDFAQIVAKREEALARGILLADDTDFVPGTIRVGQNTVPVDLRLKGDWTDHYAYDKWSFRVETKGDHYIQGMNTFSLQDPSTRTYLHEWAFMAHLRAEGVLSVGYTFVHVVLNGEYKGIYALEESFAKELFESQSRREGVIIRYNEDLLWEYWATYSNDGLTPRGVTEFHIIDEFESRRIDASPALAAQRDIAVGKLRALDEGKLSASEVFDVEAMGKFLAISDFWGAGHALIWHNLRFYYNPITARLEPIGFDTQAMGHGTSVELKELTGLQQAMDYDDPVMQWAYVHYLWHYSQPGYVEWLQNSTYANGTSLGAEFDRLQAVLLQEFTAEQLASPWELLVQRQVAFRELLMPYQTTYVYVENLNVVETAGGAEVSLVVANLLDLPLDVHEVVVGDKSLRLDPAWVTEDTLEHIIVADIAVPVSIEGQPVFGDRESRVPGASNSGVLLRPLPLDADKLAYVRLQIPRQVLTDTFGMGAQLPAGLSLATRVWGLTRTLTQTIIPAYAPVLAEGPMSAQPTLSRALAQHPYLERATESGMLTIAPGTWDIEGDLLLPYGYGLHLEPGTTLRFGPESYLLANGPLIFEGTASAPVVLQPQESAWKGIVVLESRSPSFWHYVTVEHTDAVSQNGWSLTGGITFYRSPIHVSYSRILGTLAEDGFNVVRAEFEFVDTEFADTASDAFDADFASGRFERCVFHDIAADGIDVSGSDVQVYDVQMRDLGDKGLSVGEQSYVTAERVTVERSDFGLVSKDLSYLTATDVTLTAPRIAALAAYIKKPSYGPATMMVKNAILVDVSPEQTAVVQTGSWIDLNGDRIWGTDVDIDALYEKWQKP